MSTTIKQLQGLIHELRESECSVESVYEYLKGKIHLKYSMNIVVIGNGLYGVTVGYDAGSYYMATTIDEDPYYPTEITKDLYYALLEFREEGINK